MSSIVKTKHEITISPFLVIDDNPSQQLTKIGNQIQFELERFAQCILIKKQRLDKYFKVRFW